MIKRTVVAVVLIAVSARFYVAWAAQERHSQQYEREMQDPVDDPPDADRKAEYAFARLRYRQYTGNGLNFGFGFRGRRGGGRGGGRGRSSWGVDSNRADRLFAIAMKRLTRIDTQSVEEVIDIDDGPMFDYPWLYAVEVGHWSLSDEQARKLRDYLDRGGFLMVDDFHGTAEWAVFLESFKKIFPDREIVDIPDSDSIFHVVSDLGDRFQVPGIQYLRSGNTFEQDGYSAEWRAVYDDKGRIQVAICHNMDLGDAWQYADYPYYPEKFASLAFRIGVNYVAYAMTH